MPSGGSVRDSSARQIMCLRARTKQSNLPPSLGDGAHHFFFLLAEKRHLE
jgi:hypothetical protein